MIRDILIATHNPDKLKELEELVNPLKLRLHFLRELPGFYPTEEDQETLQKNAMKKALEAAKYSGLITLADDTGLFIEALNGAPGIMSARFAGNSCSYSDNRQKVLRLLQNIQIRKAYFKTAVALSAPDGIIAVTEGRLEGEITTEERGNNGFGYDSIFAVNGKTYAEMNADEKNHLSHRALAIKSIIPILQKIINN
ncbi:MAG TPA: RdgB/HAM1 family non-canonical purine NTP pyrophosphatase [Candidatus Cloacimonas acidaminovorans]|jgi:XTP/dITP diphosphohydrolase|nr:RdgB/HAM1 family non-canonical purine NTP pyrophosphatase [Candidatus Cloacimonas acidaminovorans]HPC51181.1 RdgB/HAM1 family non-canonical purine NTP pyrophosphatase [Candidatus Cloacimonas acidaminovorans]HPI43211.1 RdgB/HAM1 family non-canonical purine NTP pyrophosphatase [Candidatus Cloacimonas acidaminovorans]HRS61090.1 RdgB/HAM1 family non-canonical purine NTP pyrophosphatase [Candidatus Cloacimonas sp.]